MIFYEGKLKYTPGSEMPFDGTDIWNQILMPGLMVKVKLGKLKNELKR